MYICQFSDLRPFPGHGLIPNFQVWVLRVECWRYQTSEFKVWLILNTSFKLRSQNILGDLLKNVIFNVIIIFFIDND